jgi:hypothetical protein
MTDTYSWDDLLKTADEAGFSVLDPGEYDVRIKTAEAIRFGSGRDGIKTNMEVIAGPSKGRGGIFNNFVLSPENPQAVGFFFRNMGTFGLDRNYFAAKPSLAKVATDMVGRTARIQIAHREWNGQTQMDVKSMKPIPGGTAAPAPTASPLPQPTPVAQPQPAPAPVAPAPAPAPVAPQPVAEVPAQPVAPVAEAVQAPAPAQAAAPIAPAPAPVAPAPAERPAPPVSPF